MIQASPGFARTASRGPLSGAVPSVVEMMEMVMSTTKVPTQTSHRSSRTGQFVTERQAQRSPATTERERIKHPERKK